jgi:hypothetical protein
MWSNGILAINGGFWGWLLTFLTIFFIHVSLYGFAAQFIYRYLTLNRFAASK